MNLKSEWENQVRNACLYQLPQSNLPSAQAGESKLIIEGLRWSELQDKLQHSGSSQSNLILVVVVASPDPSLLNQMLI